MIKPTQEEIEIIANLIKKQNVDCVDIFVENLQKYVNLVLEENQNHNLIGENTVQNIWSRHIIDSLQLVQYFDNKDKNKQIVDLGSGAGFPAIPLCLALQNQTIMVEKSQVKANFLQKVIEELKLNQTLSVSNLIITKQNNQEIFNKPTVITSRAFKPLKDILDLIGDNKNIEKIILLKGKTWQNEVEDAKKEIQKTCLKTNNYPSIVSQEGVVLVLNK